MNRSYDDIPLQKSDYGAARYQMGRRLVAEAGLSLDQVVWDADEVLWDWVMDAARMLKGMPRAVLQRDVGHREFYILKPGVFELIWGMHHACLEAGRDASMRIWTNGYPWRLWRVACEVPGFTELLGPPAEAACGEHVDGDRGRELFAGHPNMFYRGDFTEAAERLLGPEGGRLKAAMPRSAREVIERQFARDPFDSSLKLPEFAPLVDKPGFQGARVLIDDHVRNVERFIASGRLGVHVVSRAPRIMFGKVPNTVWRHPLRRLRGLHNDVGGSIVDGLWELSGASAPAIWPAEPTAPPDGHPQTVFEFDVPDRRLREEWIEPIRQLKSRWPEV